jgi:hypothetical protein
MSNLSGQLHLQLTQVDTLASFRQACSRLPVHVGNQGVEVGEFLQEQSMTEEVLARSEVVGRW